ncbi:MAG: TIGR04076 family protein [Paramuribaculum sp.]|nr:TIGR04076 family protein [Paramuribaculum sp.]MDE6322629.1 TIGR04076 family protein [Paramuribaculum sp.]
MNVNRRQFCKFSFLGLIAAILSPGKALGAAARRNTLSGECLIEVVRCHCFQDLQGRYLDDPEAGPCQHFSVGEKLRITPRNLQSLKESGRICPQAWKVLEPYVMAALSDRETTECAPALKSNYALISCPDGTRPVIFKLTAG